MVALLVRHKHVFRHHCKHVKQLGPADEGTKENQSYVHFNHYHNFPRALVYTLTQKWRWIRMPECPCRRCVASTLTPRRKLLIATLLSATVWNSANISYLGSILCCNCGAAIDGTTAAGALCSDCLRLNVDASFG